jgi:hypothetical protein
MNLDVFVKSGWCTPLDKGPRSSLSAKRALVAFSKVKQRMEIPTARRACPSADRKNRVAGQTNASF